MDNNEYKRLEFLLLFFDETEIVRTSGGGIFEEEWNDDNADENGWT